MSSAPCLGTEVDTTPIVIDLSPQSSSQFSARSTESSILASGSKPSPSSPSSLSLPDRTLSVKFAPLPVTPLKKRRSALPLGVSGRAERLRSRRVRREPCWADGPESAQLVEIQDPLMMLGKYVKSRSISLWRQFRRTGETESVEALQDVSVLEITGATIDPQGDKTGRDDDIWEEKDVETTEEVPDGRIVEFQLEVGSPTSTKSKRKGTTKVAIENHIGGDEPLHRGPPRSASCSDIPHTSPS